MIRIVLLACAVHALLDGAVCEAAGIAAVAAVLAACAPDGCDRPVGLRLRWWGGGWRT